MVAGPLGSQEGARKSAAGARGTVAGPLGSLRGLRHTDKGLEAEQLGSRRALSHCWRLREGGDTQT